MALHDLLDKPPAPPMTGLPCSLGKLEADLPAEEADALRRMLHPLGWTAPQIRFALEAEGHVVGFQTINRHRRGICRCGRAEA